VRFHQRLAKLEAGTPATTGARESAAREAAQIEEAHARIERLGKRVGEGSDPAPPSWGVTRLREIAAMNEADAVVALAEYRAGAPARLAARMIPIIERSPQPHSDNTKAVLAQLRAVLPSTNTKG